MKIYSPNVKSIEVVKRAEKRARRARLYYMRYVILLRNLRILGPALPHVEGRLRTSGAKIQLTTGNRNTTEAAWSPR